MVAFIFTSKSSRDARDDRLALRKKPEENEILLFDRKYSVRIDVPFQIIILLLQGSDVFVKLIFDGLDLHQLSL